MESSNHRALEEIKMLFVNEASSACEATPVSVAEVPGTVMCVIDQRTDLCHQRGGQTLEGRASPPARVCLEKRFLSILCHSAETPGNPPMCAHAEKWSRSDKLFLDSSQQPELIFPQELACGLRADKGSESVMRDLCVVYTDTAAQHTAATLKDEAVDESVLPVRRVHTRAERSSENNWKTRASVLGMKRGKRTRSQLDHTQRREIHNKKERDRRRRIRLCCDELNVLVPFCDADTDKATTLQWTTAFLKYIREIHGDSIKHDFQSSFCGKTGLRLNSGSASTVQHYEPSKDTKPESSSHN